MWQDMVIGQRQLGLLHFQSHQKLYMRTNSLPSSTTIHWPWIHCLNLDPRHWSKDNEKVKATTVLLLNTTRIKFASCVSILYRIMGYRRNFGIRHIWMSPSVSTFSSNVNMGKQKIIIKQLNFCFLIPKM